MLDHSFPRSEGELSLAAVALGELEALVEQGSAQILLTPVLCDFLDGFDWSKEERNRIVNDIYRLLLQWTMRQHGASLSIDLADVTGYAPHPVPNECLPMGLVEVWSDEIGRLLKCHDDDCNDFCIGIASCLAFGGGECAGYHPGPGARSFPLVGPKTTGSLEDAYEYALPLGASRSNVSFNDAYRNVHLLGAIGIDNPPGGSHYKVRFANQRPWPLDRNLDPIPEKYLKELVGIVGMPLDVICHTLANGELPPVRLRISRLR